MGRVLFIAALFAVLAACSLKTPEGAACNAIGEVSQCPEGQRCGADSTCSLAAMACEEPICTANSCNGQELTRCVPDVVGVCTHTELQECSPQQRCDETSGACECLASCGDYRICGLEDGVPGQSCVCKPDGGCTEVGTMCAEAGAGTIDCESHDGCYHALDPVGCTDPGKTCKGTLPNAACQCPDSGPLADEGCTEGAGATCSASGQVLTCQRVAVGSECFVWRVAFACGSGLTCTPGGAGACACPAHPPASRTLFADPASPESAFVQPNGADVDYCRFKTVQAAVAGAASGDTVKATGTGPVVVFREPGFTIKGGVSVVGDESAPAEPAQVVIELTGIGQGLVLETGASLRGVTVRKAGGAAATIGIEVGGASPATGPSLKHVVVDAQGVGGAFDTGVLVSGAGAVSIQDLTVLDARASGLGVLRASPSDAVAVADLLAKRNTVGVKVEVGDLTLSAASIELSAQQGVLAAGSAAAAVGLDITGSTIKFNQRGGVRAGNLSRFHLSGSKLCRNASLPEDVPGLATQRTFGGLLLIGEAPGGAAPGGNSIKDSTFTDNDGDQVAVLNSRAGGGVLTTWNLASGACGPTTSNVFDGYNPSLDPVSGFPIETGLFASDAGANATRSAWQMAPPNPNRDFLQVAGGEVTSGTEGGALNYCTLVQVEADTTCPDVPALP
jgi:hypothetical protein